MSRALALSSTVKLSSGYEMPLLGLGVYKNNDAMPACLAALKHGYRHIDSARLYGNEAQVGEAVRQSGLKREEVFITSKVFPREHGYEKTKKAVAESLERFEFEYLDLFLIHRPSATKELRIETWRSLLELKAEGKLRTVGVSNYSLAHFEEIHDAGLEMPAVNQIELQPFCQQKVLSEYCKEKGIIVQAYCPLVRGKFDDPVIVEVARKYNKTAPQILVRWSLQKGYVPLPKSSDPERVVSNSDVYDFNISDEDMAKLDSLHRGRAGAVSQNPVDHD